MKAGIVQAPETHIDKALTQRMQRGDSAAFDEFFNANFARLYRFTIARIGNEEDDVKEIVQRTLCRAVKKIHTYRGEAALFTWLCRLCRNEISDHLKQRNRERTRTSPFDDEEVRHVLENLDSGASNDPEQEYRRIQVSRTVQAVLDHLPPRQGDVLEWKYIQGLTVREIATRMEVSQLAVQSLLARARNAFRDAFAALAGTSPELLSGSSDGSGG